MDNNLIDEAKIGKGWWEFEFGIVKENPAL